MHVSGYSTYTHFQRHVVTYMQRQRLIPPRKTHKKIHTDSQLHRNIPGNIHLYAYIIHKPGNTHAQKHTHVAGDIDIDIHNVHIHSHRCKDTHSHNHLYIHTCQDAHTYRKSEPSFPCPLIILIPYLPHSRDPTHEWLSEAPSSSGLLAGPPSLHVQAVEAQGQTVHEA